MVANHYNSIPRMALFQRFFCRILLTARENDPEKIGSTQEPSEMEKQRRNYLKNYQNYFSPESDQLTHL